MGFYIRWLYKSLFGKSEVDRMNSSIWEKGRLSQLNIKLRRAYNLPGTFSHYKIRYALC